MSNSHYLRSYDYVNHGYEAVRDALRRDALAIFERATRAGHAESRGPELHARVGALTLSVPIALQIVEIGEAESYGLPATRLVLEWQAARGASVFPTMKANLDVYALSPHETQLDLCGTYDPPLGILGDAGDALVASRIAEVSVQRFVSEVAAYLRELLA